MMTMVMMNMAVIVLVLLAVVREVSSQAYVLPLICPSDCTVISSDYLVQCHCDNDAEIYTSCTVPFGWYDNVKSPCEFKSVRTQTFNVTFAWNNYKDCGGDTSDPCQYFNGTALYSDFGSYKLSAPFAWSQFTFQGNASDVHSLYVVSSDISGFGRLLVVPVYN